ncbi:hypothetical protein KAH51_02460 [Proteus vulgaris]|uniref:hypothetical protein n=1 Tax=Proteus vulgaris TaxID=585 RepID=UPI001B38CDA6|nr:hypothetical protein [Proteus vulgaris]MBQ0212319.1 hypothetical protein [Proteus vulgaris]
MKIFFKILLMVLFLTACSSYTKIDSNKSGDIIKVKSALIENDNLYILSDSTNYHFKGEAITALKKFATSKYNQKVIYFSASLGIMGSVVNGSYMIYLDPKDFTIDELDELASTYHFYRSNYQSNSDEEMIKNQIPNYENRFFIIGKFYANGEMVNLSNKDELLEKYSLPKPIFVNVNYYSKHLTPSDTLKTIAVMPFQAISLILVAPLYIILLSAP